MQAINLFSQPTNQVSFMLNVSSRWFMDMVFNAAASMLTENNSRLNYSEPESAEIVARTIIAINKAADAAGIITALSFNEVLMPAVAKLELLETYVELKNKSECWFVGEFAVTPILVYYALLEEHNTTVQVIYNLHRQYKNKKWDANAKYQQESLFDQVAHWPERFRFSGMTARRLPKDVPGYLEAPFPPDDDF